MESIESQFCYLTTTGRRTGRPHTIEIWFGVSGRTLYLLSGSHHSDWVQNLVADPAVVVRVGDEVGPATARLVAPQSEEDALARRIVLEKYQAPGASDLDHWGRTALVVAIDR